MIPKTLHFVWIGSFRIPDEFAANIISWRERHPHWKIILWSDMPELQPGAALGVEVRDLPPLVNKQYLSDLDRMAGQGKWAARSDLVRYEVVARYGGVYMDTDVRCFRCIDELLEGVDLFVCDEVYHCNGNYGFGARPNHPAMWTVVREVGPRIEMIYDKGRPKDFPNIVEITGPVYFNAQLRKYQSGLVVFPAPLFNPLGHEYDPNQVSVWPDSAFANHDFAGTWYDRDKKTPPPEFRKERVNVGISKTSGDSQPVGHGTGCAPCERRSILARARRLRQPAESG